MDSITVFYSGKTIMYELPYYSSKDFIFKYKTDDTALIPQSTEIKHKYFIFQKDSFTGFLYPSSDATNYKLINVDSLNKKSILTNFNYFYASIKNKSILTNEDYNSNGDYIEKFIPKLKPDVSYNDTTIYYYSNDSTLKDIPFSFAEELDKTHKQKLYKIQLIYNTNPKGPDWYSQQGREIIIYFKVISDIQNEAEISKIFKKFESGINNNNHQP